MLIYFILYGILIFMAYWCFQTDAFGDEKKSKKAFCIVGFILLALLMSLRHPSSGIDIIGSGGESIGYAGVYGYVAKLPWSKILTASVRNYERGFIIFEKLLSLISKDSQILIASCGIIQAICLFVLINKSSKKPLMSTIIYFALPCFFICWSGLRQSIAISITMIAFLMIKEKKPIRFVLLVVLAWLFHSSAIVFLIAYPLYYLKQSSIWKLVSVMIIPLVYVARVPLFNVFSVIFKDEANTTETGAFTLFIVFVAMYIFLTLFTNRNNRLSNGCTNLFWIACLAQAFSGISNLAMRVGYYFMIYAIIVIPEILTDENEGNSLVLNYKYKKLLGMIVFLAFAGYGLYTIYSAQGSSWFTTNPYRFFWEKA